MKKEIWQKNRISIAIMFCVIAIMLIMAMVEILFKPGYLVKSLIKIVLFLLTPIIYFYIKKESLPRKLFGRGKGGPFLQFYWGSPLPLMLDIFCHRTFFDLSGITRALTENTGITEKNFVYVSLYISFVNSLLEEFFFRGFSFLILKKHITRKRAQLFSAGAFALYHIAIIAEWVSIPLIALLIAALFVGGILFNMLNERFENIYASWMVHMFANLQQHHRHDSV